MIERVDVGQYDTRFDSQRFVALESLRDTIAYEDALKREVLYTHRQLETDNRERLNVTESHFVYEIRDGKLFGQDEIVPFEKSLKKAVEEKIGYSREHADLDAFSFFQKVLTDPETPNGTIVFNPSPPDGNNKMNFLDVHTRVGDTVHSVRYLSNLTNAEYRQKILEINPAYEEVLPENPTDKDFLKTPVIVPNHLDFTPDSLADYFIPERKILGISKEKHDEIWRDLSPQIISMINVLVENPNALDEIEDRYNRIQIKATELAGGINFLLQNGKNGVIVYVDERPQMIAGGGCAGGSCSRESSKGISDEYGDLSYKCPECKKINTRSPGMLDSNCPKCGSDKVLPSSVKKS